MKTNIWPNGITIMTGKYRVLYMFGTGRCVAKKLLPNGGESVLPKWITVA